MHACALIRARNTVMTTERTNVIRQLRKLFLVLVTLATCAFMTVPVYAQNSLNTRRLLHVGDTVVQRIMPKPVSDSTYLSTDYTEIHFELNKADLNISYMDNGLSMLRLDRVIDSIGIENISAIEIISQSSPEGTLERNTWLTEHRSKAIQNYLYRVFPELKSRISINKITESWENLAQYVALDPILDEGTKNKILDIIDSKELSVATKKSKLKNSLGKDEKVGDVYAYLTKYYYPVIRNSGIYILHMLEPEPEFDAEPRGIQVEEPTPTPTDSIAYTPEIAPIPESPHKRPLLAVKTNLLYDAFFTNIQGWTPIYNVEAELYPTENGRWSWLVEYEFPWHHNDDNYYYLQILNLQFEARRYFKKDSYHTGHYLSAYIGTNAFDICFDPDKGKGYQGEGGGGGLGYGYVLPLGRKPDTRWKLEFFVKAGIYIAKYDPYDAGDPFAGKYYYIYDDYTKVFMKRNWKFQWLFYPTGAGITLSYDLIHVKSKNKNKTLIEP